MDSYAGYFFYFNAIIMKKLLTILFIVLALGVNAQMRDFLSVPKTAMLKEMKTNTSYTHLEINADTVTAMYNNVAVLMIFRDSKVFIQQLIYERSMANTIVEYLNKFVATEPLKMYINFNVDPPTIYNVEWESDYIILIMHE